VKHSRKCQTRVFLLHRADLDGRQIDISKLKDVSLTFELTMDIDALHREADVDGSGERKSARQRLSLSSAHAKEPCMQR
jgi:hypothetical protein